MIFEEKDLPRNHNTGMREMLEDEEAEEDIVVLNWEEVEHVAEDWSQPPSEDDEKEEPDQDDDPMPIVDDAIHVLKNHSRPVFCCAIHPSLPCAVTGGEDDKAILWNLSTNTPSSILELSHYKESVNEVGFSFDGSLLAIANMMGDIEVYRIESNLQATKVWSERIEEVQWMEWHEHAHVLLAGGLGTSVYMWKIPSGECRVLFGECSSPIGTFMPDGKRAVIAYRNGGVKVFNLVRGEATCTFKQSNWRISEIISVAVHPHTNLAVVGDTSGNIALFTTHAPSKVVHEHNFMGHFENREGEEFCYIENLMFSQDNDVSSLLITTSRALFIWDYVRQSLRRCVMINQGVTKMIPIGTTDLVAIGTTSGAIDLVDYKQGVIVKTFTGHVDSILSLAITRDQKYLMTTSDDTTVRLFNLEECIEAT